jgi:putative DNA primase/helicase
MNPITDFRDAMQRGLGVTLPPSFMPIPDAGIKRTDEPGKSKGNKNIWYVLHADGIPAGSFGNWSTGESGTWSAKCISEMTIEEKTILLERARREKLQREAMRTRQQRQAALYARRLWKSSQPAWKEHPYLLRKNIPALGLRIDGTVLLVPMITTDAKLMNLQRILPDGTKRFLKHGQITGCFAPIGGRPKDKVIICEGFATGLSLYMKSKVPVACAMNCGNLLSVSIAHREKYPDVEIIVASDYDHCTEGNPGLTKACEASKAVNGTLLIPPAIPCGVSCTCSDWNDYLNCTTSGN